MRRLTLREGDGKLFEKIYYLALSIADPEKAERLFAERRRSENPLDRYWQNRFNEYGGTDNVLVSAIVNTLDMPFCAYVLTRREPDLLEISPWLLSGKVNGDRMEHEALSDDVTDETLLYYARMFALTADFISWLEKREKKGARAAE